MVKKMAQEVIPRQEARKGLAVVMAVMMEEFFGENSTLCFPMSTAQQRMEFCQVRRLLSSSAFIPHGCYLLKAKKV